MIFRNIKNPLFLYLCHMWAWLRCVCWRNEWLFSSGSIMLRAICDLCWGNSLSDFLLQKCSDCCCRKGSPSLWFKSIESFCSWDCLSPCSALLDQSRSRVRGQPLCRKALIESERLHLGLVLQDWRGLIYGLDTTQTELRLPNPIG